MTGERPESAHPPPCRPLWRRSFQLTDSSRSGFAAGTGQNAPFSDSPVGPTREMSGGCLMLGQPSASSPSTTSAAPRSSGSKRARTRSNGHGCPAVPSPPMPSAYSFTRWPITSVISCARRRSQSGGAVVADQPAREANQDRGPRSDFRVRPPSTGGFDRPQSRGAADLPLIKALKAQSFLETAGHLTDVGLVLR